MYLELKVVQLVQTMLSSEWDSTTKKRIHEPVQMYEYQRHVFGAKSSPTCAGYALKRVGLDNEKDYPIKSVDTPEEALEVFNQLQPLLSQHGLELKKWISNNDAVTKAIPENLKSISNTKQVEVEPNTEGSLVLGLQ